MSNAQDTAVRPFRDGDAVLNSYIREGDNATTGNPTGLIDVAYNNNTLYANKPLIFSQFNSKDGTGITQTGINATGVYMYYLLTEFPYLRGRTTVTAEVLMDCSANCHMDVTIGAATGTVAITTGTAQLVTVDCTYTASGNYMLLMRSATGTVNITVYSVKVYLKAVAGALTVDHASDDVFLPVDVAKVVDGHPLSVALIRNLQVNNNTVHRHFRGIVSSMCIPFSPNIGSPIAAKEMPTLEGAGYDIVARLLYFRSSASVARLLVRVSGHTDNFVGGDGAQVFANFTGYQEQLSARLPQTMAGLADINGYLTVPPGMGPHEITIYGHGDATDSGRILTWMIVEVVD